ncbi:MAG: SpoIIE family protein phosphatase [Spirochaetales bacterium]|nr:SpoIIE family protein phosphatase [Spirochaetales bacterium]
MESTFFDVGSYQIKKNGESAPGDAFLSRKVEGRQRIISVLSDGLGSGIRANVLSSLTATMALRSVEKDLSVLKTAELISRTLPICSIRQISYATFTIVDIDEQGDVQILEYDNPHFILIRNNEASIPDEQTICFKPETVNRNEIRSCKFRAQPGDRLIFFSDGVTQSGLGTAPWPLGWGEENVRDFICKILRKEPEISSDKLSRKIVRESLKNDVYKAMDDITCGAVYFRKPRRLLIVSGPPYNAERDPVLAETIRDFQGRTIISGGTTANIVSRELDRPIHVDLTSLYPDIPPVSGMEGIFLVTEGIITLGRVSEYIKDSGREIQPEGDPAERILAAMIDSDIIEFIIGTRINDAHQDPNMPVELEIRRNIIKKIAEAIKTKHLKEVHISYI